MNLKNRLSKLEQSTAHKMTPLVMIPAEDNHWTPDQLQQMEIANKRGRMVIKVNFVGVRQDVGH